jgi:uncharacterized protein (TIGR02996 family)
MAISEQGPMDHHAAFLADICERPEDDAPRLIYADWLEEQGGADYEARAEFIRVQIALTQPSDGPRQTAALKRREDELRALHEEGWRARLPDVDGVNWGPFKRGFVSWVQITDVAAFRRGAAEMFSFSPVRRLTLQGQGHDLEQLAATPELVRLLSLHFQGNLIGDRGALALAASPNLRRLVALDLSHNEIGTEGAIGLARSAHLGRLALLDLTYNPIGDDGATALAASTQLASLVSLDVRWCDFRDEAREALRARFGKGARL